MEFKVINNINEMDFKRILKSMVGSDFKLEFTDNDIKQSYSGEPFIISVQPKNGYIKVFTSLENGWPFLQHLIEANKFTAMSIRYFENSLAEFHYWVNGELIRMQHALKDSNWVWFGKGEYQEWEETSKYSSRMIKKRLTREMLENYLKKCGCNESVA